MTVSVHLTSSSATSVHRPSPSHHRPIRRVSTPPRIAKPLFAAGQALNEQRLLQREQHQPTFRIVTTNEAGRHDAARGSASYRVLPAPRAPLRGGLGLFDEEDTFYVEPIIREVDSEFDDESASDGNANTRGELDSTGKKVAGTSAAVALITSETIAADWKQLVALHSLPTLPEHRATASSSSSLSSMTAALDDRSPSMSSSPGSTTASAAEDSGSDDVDSLGGGGGLQTPPAVPEKQLLQLQIQQQQRLVRRSGSKNGTSRGDAASLSGSSSGRSNASRRLSGREPGENWLTAPATTAPIAWGARAQSVSSASSHSTRTPSLRRSSRNSLGSIVNVDLAAANAMNASSDMLAVTERPQTPVVLGGQTLDLATLLPPPRVHDEMKLRLRRQSWGGLSADGDSVVKHVETAPADTTGRRERKERPRPIGIPFMGDAAAASETNALFGSDGAQSKATYAFVETPLASAKTALSELSNGGDSMRSDAPPARTASLAAAAPSTPRTPTLPDASDEGKFIGSTKSFPSPIQAGFRTPRSVPANRESVAARQANGFRNARVLTFGPELGSAGHARTVSLGTAPLKPVAEFSDNANAGNAWKSAWDPVSPQAPNMDVLEPSSLSPLAVPASLPEPVSYKPVSFRTMSPPPPVGVIGLGEGLAGGPQRDTRGKKIDLNRWRRADPLVVGRPSEAAAVTATASPAKPTFKKRFSQSLLNLLGDSSGEKSRQQEEAVDPFAADVPQPMPVAKSSALSKIFSFGRNASKLALVDTAPSSSGDAPPAVPERSSSHRNSAFLRQRQRQRINEPLSRIPYSPSMPMLVEGGSPNEVISSQTRVLSWLSASQQDLSRPSKQQPAYTQSSVDLRYASSRSVAPAAQVVPTGLPIDVAEEDDDEEAEVAGGREDAARRLSGLHRVYGAGVTAQQEPEAPQAAEVSAETKQSRRQSSLGRLSSFFGASKISLVDSEQARSSTPSPSSNGPSSGRKLSFGFRRSRSSKNVTAEAAGVPPSPPPKANRRFSRLFSGSSGKTSSAMAVTAPIVEEDAITIEPTKTEMRATTPASRWEIRKSIIDQSFDVNAVMSDVEDRLSSDPRSAGTSPQNTFESNAIATSPRASQSMTNKAPGDSSPRTSARSASPHISDESSIPESLLEPAMIGQVINAPFHREANGAAAAERRRSAVTLSLYDMTAQVHRQGQVVV